MGPRDKNEIQNEAKVMQAESMRLSKLQSETVLEPWRQRIGRRVALAM